MTIHLLSSTAGTEGSLVLDLFVVLACAGAVALLMQRLRLVVIPAYLITGVLIGPHALGLGPSPESLGDISHIAVILLLFGIGLELNLTALKQGFARMMIIGVGSCVLTILLGLPLALLAGLSPPAALTVCMALSLSSTAVVLRVIADRRELRHASGRLALSILVLQDVLVLPMLASIPLLAVWSGVGTESDPSGEATMIADGFAAFARDAALRVGGVSALIVFGRLLLPRLLRESLKGRSLEVMMIVGVATAFGAAVIAQAIGFSLEMGAFLAGFLLAGTTFRHQLRGQIGPLRDLLIALFFTTVGMTLDPWIALESWWVVLLAGAVMTVVKTVAIGGTCWGLGATASMAAGIGLSLGQAGEFSLVFLDTSQKAGLLDERVTAILATVVVISLIITPALVQLSALAGRMFRRVGCAPWMRSHVFQERPVERLEGEEDRGHVIVAGFGPIGRMIVERLEKENVRLTIVELNPATVQHQKGLGKRVLFGDIANVDVLESADIESTDALILTIPDDEAVTRACVAARRLAPQVFIAARMGVVSHLDMAREAGADHVTVDELAAAEAMVSAVMDRVHRQKHDASSNGKRIEHEPLTS